MTDALPQWPDFGLTDDVRPALRQAREAGHPMVLATLVALGGGGPRPVGTQMVFAEGIVAGYFSGGCVEGDVAGHATACLADGRPRALVYGQGSPWPDIRLLCGARVEIFMERIGPDDTALAELLDADRDRRDVVYVSDGETRACAPTLEPWPGAAVVRRHSPAPRLIVVGADPAAMAIAALGAQSGIETTLVRPKGPETPPPLSGVAYRRDAPNEALAAVGLDPWTAVAVASHDMDMDEAALLPALASDCGYVGLLGARARLSERLSRLRANGATDRDLARLRAPIGLDLGGKAPWEVAVAVIGEIVALRYARSRGQTSTMSPTDAAAASAGRLSKAVASANTLTSEES